MAKKDQKQLTRPPEEHFRLERLGVRERTDVVLEVLAALDGILHTDLNTTLLNHEEETRQLCETLGVPFLAIWMPIDTHFTPADIDEWQAAREG